MKKLLLILVLITICSLIVKTSMSESVGNNRAEKKISNSVGMEFIYVPSGSFERGSPSAELGRNSDENKHLVKMVNSFYMQTTEVTQRQWKTVMGNLPTYTRKCDDNCPVDRISWNIAQKFINKLNEIEGSQNYRLPTEAEWEYASRAGSKTAFANGEISELNCDIDSNLDKIGWYCGNARKYPHHHVAQKNPNSWGLYDMHGSVWEWCSDWYTHYALESVTSPTGPSDGTERVLRGGGIADTASSCRSSNRYSLRPDIMFDNIGFRVVLSL